MKIMKPNALTASMLTSSTAVEVAPAAYSAGTNYSAGATVSIAGTAGQVLVYQSLQAGNLGHAPASSPTWWRYFGLLYQPYSVGATYAAGDRVQDLGDHSVYQSLVSGNVGHALTETTVWALVGANNRWAMFDNAVGTSTAVASPLAVVLTPGPTDGLGLLEMVGRRLQVLMKDAPAGATVYYRDIDLDASVVESVFDWFFAEFEQMSDLALTDLPSQFGSAELTVTITGTTGLVSCGVCKPCQVKEIGRTLSKPQVSMTDYSVKTTDRWGATRVEELPFSKRASFQALTEKFRFNNIFRTLTSLRATPAFYIGVDQFGYEPLLLYGFFRDFTISVDYLTHHLCSIEVEGLSQ